jgi:single-strand DNA-binding protein
MQKLFLAGNVGRDATLRATQGGDHVLNFTLAVDNGKDKSGERRPATWFDCSLWGDRARKLEPYIRKGSRVALMGRPTAREHDGKAYLGIVIDDLTFMSGAEGGGDRDSRPADPGLPKPGGGGRTGRYTDLDMDDEIPF